MAGMEAIPAAREKMVAGWTWIPVESLLFFFLLLGCYFYFSGATVFLLVRLTPPFFFWRGLVESGLDSSVFFGGGGGGAVWAFWEARPALGWIGHGSSIFFCCSIRPTFSVMCGLSCSVYCL